MRTFETPALLQKFRASHNTANIISNIISTGLEAGLSGLNSILNIRFGYVGQLESQLKGFASFSSTKKVYICQETDVSLVCTQNSLVFWL